MALDPLSFEGIRRAFPSLRSRGEVRGRFRSEGTLGRLAVDGGSPFRAFPGGAMLGLVIVYFGLSRRRDKRP